MGTAVRDLHRATFEYQLWQHRLVSDFDLGALQRVSEPCNGHAIRIWVSPEKSWPQLQGKPVFEDPFENGDPWFASWKAGDGYIVRFPECSFHIQPSEMCIEYDPAPGVAESTIAHLILDHAIPRLLSLTPGFVVFHASAVQIEDRVIAVLGKSGQGKSTLAASFAAQGYPLLTDDCLVVRWDEGVGQWLAQPSYQSVRLWPDSVGALGIPDSELREFAGYSLKKRTGREVDFRFASEEAPLAACFVLPQPEGPAHSGPPELRPLAVNEAFLALTGAVFRIDPKDPGVNRREFGALTNLTNSVRFWSLQYERDYERLPEVRAAMLRATAADRIRGMTTSSNSDSEKFVVPKTVLSRTVGSETILLNLETSTYHSLNAVGGRFWVLVQEGSDFEQALTVMRGEYAVDAAQLEADLRALCAELLGLKLIEAA